jgi:hypothetical protein
MNNKTITTTLVLLSFYSTLFAQSTFTRVYQIMQDKCVNCHSNANPQNGLDLEGAGATQSQKMTDVYNNLVGVTPTNAYAAGQNFDYIYKGRTDRSFLFRKANQGLEQSITMHADENDAMPPANETQLTDVEKELIRQWILYGAPQNGIVVSEDLLEGYYGGMGLASFATPPPAPDPSEGFQVKMGPYYLSPQGQPGAELEYFQKYELNLPADVDVDRIDIKMASYSHHFILYKFDSPAAANFVSHGFRPEPDHTFISMVAAVQEATDLKLPATTAFKWDNNVVLDLNSHYINYSATQIYQAEAYFNVYTKPAGTAEHEMKTELVVNGNIPINNNGNTITYSQTVADNSFGEIFIWGIMGHTHKYGTGYTAHKRVNGQQTELIYDASCGEGIPGCVSPFFDYQHIPMRYFEPLLPINMAGNNGLIHSASWLNDGPVPVNFGPTSDDEMMVMVLMFTEEEVDFPTDNKEITKIPSLNIYPNPMYETALLTLPDEESRFSFRLVDMLGKEVRQVDGVSGKELLLERGELGSGMYVYVLTAESGKQFTGKLLVN